ncbi:MAG: hypothetical protein J6T02_02915 [Bacteroidales bacterium]|nr:hypothetical protein [Bacteroidales bacterium]
MKKVILLSFAVLALFAGCKKANTGGNGGNGEEPENYIPATAAVMSGSAPLTVTQNGTIELTVTLTPPDATPSIVWDPEYNTSTVWIDNATSKTATVHGLVNGVTSIRCTITNKEGDPIVLTKKLFILPEAVDLGFSSGVKWASANFGALDENAFGDYYAWGETATKEDYRLFTNSDTHYKWYDGVRFTKYTSPVNLDSEDDAVLKFYGEVGAKWKIPIAADFQELIDNSTVVKIWDPDNTSRLKALKFISSVPGYTDRFIVIPCAGPIETTVSAAASVQRAGLYCWSATVDNSDYSKAKILTLNGDNNPVVGSWARCNGLVIRPVLKP